LVETYRLCRFVVRQGLTAEADAAVMELAAEGMSVPPEAGANLT
jgi:hypothetical protein